MKNEKQSTCSCGDGFDFMPTPSACSIGIPEIEPIKTDGQFIYRDGEKWQAVLSATTILSRKPNGIHKVILKVQNVSDNRYMKGVISEMTIPIDYPEDADIFKPRPLATTTEIARELRHNEQYGLIRWRIGVFFFCLILREISKITDKFEASAIN